MQYSRGSSTDELIKIEKQDSLAVDTFTKNGVKVQLHVVCKTLPFNITVRSSKLLCLHSTQISTKLIYDCDIKSDEAGTGEAGKEVEVIKSIKPMESVTHVSKDGRTAIIENKLNILTSQHQGAYFTIVITVLDTKNNQKYTLYSHPMKAVSKKVVAKRSTQKASSSDVSVKKISSSSEPQRASIKRSAIELLAESMLRLERHQQEQDRRINTILRNQFESCGKTEFQFSSPFGPNTDFESTFRAFLESWNSIEELERPNKIRNVIQLSTNEEKNILNNFVGYLSKTPERYENNLHSSLESSSQMNKENIDSELSEDINLMGVNSDADTLGTNSHQFSSSSDFESDIYSDMLSSPQHEGAFSIYQEDQTVEGDYLVEI